jgi:hypothetical protein
LPDPGARPGPSDHGSRLRPWPFGEGAGPGG